MLEFFREIAADGCWTATIMTKYTNNTCQPGNTSFSYVLCWTYEKLPDSSAAKILMLIDRFLPSVTAGKIYFNCRK